MEKFKEIMFDDKYILEYKKSIDKDLKEYIEKNIIEEYNLNDLGHNIKHINYVLNRAIEISKLYPNNPNILYASVMFHDIACHIDRNNHEKLSSDIAYNDEFLNKFFNKDEMNIIRDAILDHRASLEYIPRNIYGKILSSVDRKVSIKEYLISSLSFNKANNSNISKDDLIENSYQFAIKKFGKNGYAVNKFYVEDNKYKDFLKDIQKLIDDKKSYYELANIVYNNYL